MSVLSRKQQTDKLGFPFSAWFPAMFFGYGCLVHLATHKWIAVVGVE
jgi:hypothetical protein